ncbi:MAG: hypothetical protein ABEJ92_02140 [Halobacteriales archaeon]
MDDLAGDRVHAGRDGAAELVVAAAPGLVTVAIGAARVGEVEVARRCSPADVAAVSGGNGRGPRLAVATDDDVLLAREPAVEALEPAGFGPAAAASIDGDRVVAGSTNGVVEVSLGDGWVTAGELLAAPTAIAGDLVGAAEGVFRVTADELRPAGLSDVADVARAAGVPLAATADGLFELGNGWLDVLPGEVELVAGASDGRAHAATADACYGRGDDRWQPVELPTDDAVRAVAYGDRTYALTAAGDLLVEAEAGWRHEPLGLEGVRAAAVL